MQLMVEIKNESIANKIIQLLEVFKNDGVEIKQTDSNKPKPKIKNQKSKINFSDDYVEKNWKEIILKAHVPDDYYKSEQYVSDRVKDWEERGKI